MKKEKIKIEKPCLKLGWCPYGSMVETFPVNHNKGEGICGVFGHDCPAFYHAEGFVDDENPDGVV